MKSNFKRNQEHDPTECHTYTNEDLSCYLDGELPDELHLAIERHLKICNSCEKEIHGYASFEVAFNGEIKSTISKMDSDLLKQQIMGRVNAGKKQVVSWKIFEKILHALPAINFTKLFNTRKFYLQLTSVAAIILLSISMVYLKKEPHLLEGPSAIVTSVDGDVSSLMILQTEEHQHTIIWYKEV